MVGDRRRVGLGGGEGRPGGRRHVLARLVAHPLGALLVEDAAGDERLLQEQDRVVGRLVGQLVDRAVLALRVGRGVRVRASHLRVDQRRARPGADVRDDVARPGADLEVVAAVDDVHGQAPKAGDELRDGRRGLLVGGDGDGVAVVGHHEQDRQVERARRVEALPELPF
jgi:hypothetical protein